MGAADTVALTDLSTTDVLAFTVVPVWMEVAGANVMLGAPAHQDAAIFHGSLIFLQAPLRIASAGQCAGQVAAGGARRQPADNGRLLPMTELRIDGQRHLGLDFLQHDG